LSNYKASVLIPGHRNWFNNCDRAIDIFAILAIAFLLLLEKDGGLRFIFYRLVITINKGIEFNLF